MLFKRSCACLPESYPALGHRADKQPPSLLYPASTTGGPHRRSNSISTPGAGCESVPCLPEEIVYFESALGVQRANEYLMTVPPLLSAQVDDLLTFRHSGPDKLLRAELSVTGATLRSRWNRRAGLSALAISLRCQSADHHHLLIGHFGQEGAGASFGSAEMPAQTLGRCTCRGPVSLRER